VVLLDEAVSNYFYVSSISVGPKKTQKYQNLETHCQEWKNPEITINRPGEYVYRVKVSVDVLWIHRDTGRGAPFSAVICHSHHYIYKMYFYIMNVIKLTSYKGY